MNRLIEQLEEKKKDYLSVVAEIEDNNSLEVRKEAKKIIEEVIIHEEIALDQINS